MKSSPRSPAARGSPTNSRPSLDLTLVPETSSGPLTDVGTRGGGGGATTGSIHQLHSDSGGSSRERPRISWLDPATGATDSNGFSSITPVRTKSGNRDKASLPVLAVADGDGAAAAAALVGPPEDGVAATPSQATLEAALDVTHVIAAAAGLSRVDLDRLSNKRRHAPLPRPLSRATISGDGSVSARTDPLAGLGTAVSSWRTAGGPSLTRIDSGSSTDSTDAESTTTTDTAATGASTASHIVSTPAARKLSSTGWPLHSQHCGAFVDLTTGAPCSRRRVATITNLLRLLACILKGKDFRIRSFIDKLK